MDVLSEALRKYFSHNAFRGQQREIIESILSGRDTLAIMPTGCGKSLCYQLPAVLCEGVTIVVSPLIALMKDQVDSLRGRGIAAAMINSAQSWSAQREVLEGLASGAVRLAYVAPERFRMRSFSDALKKAKISLFAVDEAHCISQWGHDFRPDYLRLGEAVESLGHPVCAAFTATATPDVKLDIAKQLGMRNGKIFVSGFARPNLSFNISQCSSKAEKIARAKEMVEEYRSGIIYCATRKSAEELSAKLWDDGIRHALYHGGMTARERDAAQDSFVDGSYNVAVATNAFGMGIDRPDLRFVCHYELPGSVEAYYQEAGRAGRDGAPAFCEMLFMYADKRVQEFFIDGANPDLAYIRSVYVVLRENADNSCECLMGIDDIAEAVADMGRFSAGGRGAKFGRARRGRSLSANPMSVSSSLALLRRFNFIDRFDIAGKKIRATRILNPDIDSSEIAFPAGMLEEKRRRDENKLCDMLALAYAKTCRQEWILRYFGQTDCSPCGCCDNCARLASRNFRELSGSQLTELRKALSGIARMSFKRGPREWAARFGRDKIVKSLCGSRDESLSRAGLGQLSTHGILKGHGKKFVESLVDRIVEAGLAQISGGEYPLLGLTKAGVDVMLGAPPPSFEYPEELSKMGAASRVKSSKRRAVNGAGGVSARSSGLPPAGGVADIASSSEDFNLSPKDIALFNELVAERNRQRMAMGGKVPAYLLFPNLVLKKFALLRPMSIGDAVKIKGVGELKAARFFPSMLEIIKKYSD